MGTRYHITLKNMQKLVAAGVATIGEVEAVYKTEWSDDEGGYVSTGVVNFYVHNGSVGNWQFNGYSENGITKKNMFFSGCNCGKAEIDEIFEQYGIEPQYM